MLIKLCPKNGDYEPMIQELRALRDSGFTVKFVREEAECSQEEKPLASAA
jgi:hypothetical protein